MIWNQKNTAFSIKKKTKGFEGKWHKCGKYWDIKKDCRAKEAKVAEKVKGASFMVSSFKQKQPKFAGNVFARDPGGTDQFVKDESLFNRLQVICSKIHQSS